VDEHGYLEEFLHHERASGKAEPTLRNHRRALKIAFEWLRAHGRTEADTTAADLVGFVNTLVGRCVPDHVNQYVSAIRLYFRWLKQEELCPTDPATRLKFLHAPAKPVDSLTEAECKKLVRWATTEAPRKRFGVYRSAVLAMLLLDTGMRIGEALRLTLPDIDMLTGKILVRSTKTKDFRVVPLSPFLRKHLRRYLKRRDDKLTELGLKSDRIFIAESGGELNSDLNQHAFPYVGKAAGIRRVHPHLLRHTFATQSLLNGAPLPAVMRLGGWRKLSTVQRYTYMNDEVAAQVHAQTSPLSRL